MSYGHPTHRSSADIPVTVFTSVLTSAFVTVGILFFTNNLLPEKRASTTEANSEPPSDEKLVEAPALKGLTTKVAGEVLRARGLRLVVQEERADAEIPRGQIIEQDPLSGSELNERGAVAVVVSIGPGEVKVPDIVGKPLEEAKQALKESGLEAGSITEIDTGTPGMVAESKPPKGETVKPGAVVDIVVTKTLVVPDVVGKYLFRAKKELKAAGFKIGRLRWGDSGAKDSNVILAQEPAGGTPAAPGTEVILTVNSD